jgi:hypothetical protein
MKPPLKPPPPTMQTAAPTNGRLKLAVPEPARRAPIIVLNAVEGWGKTSCGAHIPGAAIVMAPGETGYLTLLGEGLAPPIPAAAVESWGQLLQFIDDLTNDAGDTRCLVLDALGGMERLCHELVCTRDFKGDWSEDGFMAWQRGYHTSVSEWLKLLSKLERLRDRQNVMVLCLSHNRVENFRNPMADDYDRFVPDVHRKTWDATSKWSDAALFGTFITITAKKGGKTKGIGGTERVLYTEQRDAFVAKNRYNMPPVLGIPADRTEIWNTILESMKGVTQNA